MNMRALMGFIPESSSNLMQLCSIIRKVYNHIYDNWSREGGVVHLDNDDCTHSRGLRMDDSMGKQSSCGPLIIRILSIIKPVI